MKRRLRFILSLLLLCLLGIYGFQAYWLYGSYQLAQTEFARTTREALETVVQRQQLSRASKVLRIVLDTSRGPAIRAHVNRAGGVGSSIHLRRQAFQNIGQRIGRRIDSLQAGLPAGQRARLHTTVILGHPTGKVRFFSLSGKASATTPDTDFIKSVIRRNSTRQSARADSLAHRLSGLVISNWDKNSPTNLPRLARDYEAELRRRGLATDFKLDTLATGGPPTAHLQAPGTRGPVPVRVAPGRAGYPLSTPPVALNPLRGPAVVAHFPSPTAYVLRRMAGSLGGSVALLGLTTGCFALMLSTILRQKKLAEVKNDFINNMTHELKTPLATVSAAVEALQDFGALGDPRKTDAYLTIARQELTRLSDLVEKVLHIAVEERHGHVLALHPEPTQPAALVAELVGRHELQAAKPVRVDVNIAATDTLLLDRLHLAGALHNLLDNAIKYSGEQVSIRIRGRAAEGGWLLTVADDGPGIAPGYQAAVFEQFFRVPTGNLHPVKGFGLGLYYVRQVAEGHGGRVRLRSEPGHGSEFGIWLPESIII